LGKAEPEQTEMLSFGAEVWWHTDATQISNKNAFPYENLFLSKVYRQ